MRIRGFDGLRALAVLAVFAGHRTPLHGHAIGHVGVLVFFALSGFLIVGILHKARLSIETGSSRRLDEFGRFFLHRTRRIFPIYYLALAGLAVAALTGLPASGWRWDALPWHVAYLSNVYEARHGWQGALSHLWSLSIEEQFYLLAAPLLLALPARWHGRACAAAVVAGIGAHLVLRATGTGDVSVYTDSLTNFGFLALGGWLRLASDAGGTIFSKAPLPLLAGALLALGLVPDTAALGGWLILTPMLAGLFVVGVAQAQRSRLVTLLELPALVYLGRISYGFYLFHNLFWIDLPLAGKVGVVASMAANFLVSFGLAAASWRLIEAPILGKPRRREDASPVVVVPASDRSNAVLP